MILTVTLNPSVDHALFVDALRLHDTNRAARVERDAGGKGVNLSRVLHNLGGDTVASGFLGGGPGAYVRSVLDREGVPHRFVEIAGETRVNVSIEEASGKPPTCVNEPGPTVSPEELDRLADLVREALGEASWLSLGGSLPPGATSQEMIRLGEIAKASGRRLALDADGAILKAGLALRPDFIKPNAKEASRLLDRPIEDVAGAVVAAAELRNMLAEDGVAVISMGADGAVMADADGVYVGYTPPVKCVSTVGCGDSMVAAILHSLDLGRSAREAFQWGLAAGAATASSEGSGLAQLSRVEELFPAARVEAA